MRVFEKSQEARSFLENLGVVFTPEGIPTFPSEPRAVTAQDLAVVSKKAAYAIAEAERPLTEVVPEIGAIVCITGAPAPVNGKGGRRRIWETPRSPSVVSQLTASLGPDLYWFRGSGFGKLVRIFTSYDSGPRTFGVPENPAETLKAMEGLRTLFVVDTDVQSENIARLVKSCLTRAVHGEALRLSREEEAELKGLSDEERSEGEHEFMARKRSLLTAGVLFLVSTRSKAEVAQIFADHLGFTPRIWTICDNSPPTPKSAK